MREPWVLMSGITDALLDRQLIINIGLASNVDGDDADLFLLLLVFDAAGDGDVAVHRRNLEAPRLYGYFRVLANNLGNDLFGGGDVVLLP